MHMYVCVRVCVCIYTEKVTKWFQDKTMQGPFSVLVGQYSTHQSEWSCLYKHRKVIPRTLKMVGSRLLRNNIDNYYLFIYSCYQRTKIHELGLRGLGNSFLSLKVFTKIDKWYGKEKNKRATKMDLNKAIYILVTGPIPLLSLAHVLK